MGVDDRRDERTLLQVDCAEIKCSLEVNGETFPFSQISDISSSGAGVSLPLPLDTGTPVTLEFTTARRHVKVNGFVAWCESLPAALGELSDHAFRTGVRFDDSDPSSVNALFRSLRDHVVESELYL